MAREFRVWPEYRCLSQWIRTATKGLSDESQGRVLEEISAHFHDAVDDGMAQGLTEEAASEQAVRNLGSPKAARRAFRRTYLTRYQDRIVRDIVAPRKRVWFLRVYLVVAAAGLTVFELRRPTPDFGELYARAGMVALMALAVLVHMAVPGLYRRGRQRTAVALGGGADTLLWSLWLGFIAFRSPSVAESWLLLAAVVWLGIHYLPLLPKFGDRNEAA